MSAENAKAGAERPELFIIMDDTDIKRCVWTGGDRPSITVIRYLNAEGYDESPVMNYQVAEDEIGFADAARRRLLHAGVLSLEETKAMLSGMPFDAPHPYIELREAYASLLLKYDVLRQEASKS